MSGEAVVIVAIAAVEVTKLTTGIAHPVVLQQQMRCTATALASHVGAAVL